MKLNETDKELLKYMLDEDDYSYVIGLIDKAYNDGYYDGFKAGYYNTSYGWVHNED